MRATLTALPLAGAVALLLANLGGGSGGPIREALAEASPGTYAIAFRDDGGADTILAVEAGGGDVFEVAQVPRLEGFVSYGAVSPGGATLAAVVADGGTPSRPLASLQFIDLQAGAVVRALEAIDHLQRPAWTADGTAVAVTRTEAGDGAAATVTVLIASMSGAVSEAMRLPGVAGAYPVGFDAQGRLLVAAIDARGTTLYRTGADPLSLSPHITRDWQVSPDGTQLAFIESQLEEGLRYVARVVDLEPGGARAQSSIVTAGQQLGTAWRPGGGVTVGQEPGTGGARAQSAGSEGFDIPLQYSPDGAYLAVEAWSGSSFAEPGRVQLEISGSGGRTPLAGANRFAGWVQR